MLMNPQLSGRVHARADRVAPETQVSCSFVGRFEYWLAIEFWRLDRIFTMIRFGRTWTASALRWTMFKYGAWFCE
jgi:hypothetical protein